MDYVMDRKLELTDELCFSSINFNGYTNDYWTKVYNSTSPGGKFCIDLSRRFNPNRFVSRNESVWSMPWPQEIMPKYRMVTPDPNFKLTFSECCDLKAMDFKRRIHEKNEKFAMLYSGGLDSTPMVAALIKNLTAEELKNVVVYTSMPAVIENPVFWKNHIYGKINVIDSLPKKYDWLLQNGYTPVTADDGDCIFGTLIGLAFYANWEALATKANLSAESRAHLKTIIHRFNDPEVHYSEFKDLLIAHMGIPPNQGFPIVGQENPDPNFGRLLYAKFDLNCRTAPIAIRSLHDFFWWMIFNVKMLNCAVRGALYYNDNVDPKTAVLGTENWYSDPLFQQWSLNNNNNGQKVGNSAATYKQAARDYIYDLDRNDWYKTFKIKIPSMNLNTYRQQVDTNSLNGRPTSRFGLTTDWELLMIENSDVKEYIEYHLNNFQIDWEDK